MARQDELRLQFRGAGDGRVDVVDLKPQEHAVAVGLRIGIADRTVMVFDVPPVQLQDQHSARHQALVFRAAVIALATEQALVPTATRLDVAHADEGLRTHHDLHNSSGQGPTAAER